ncbi:adenine deaminase [Halanaerobium congolense]|uniref:adenine deaminase n=1 Tax=Halanaerobium congolense TaxID=54121 RepID=UPI000B801889|nr:adenine deaminase C-terminal domain-containing protein [Halanaerobium congolense]
MVEEVDILFKNANVYNSYFKKFFKGHLAVKNDRIVYTGAVYPEQIKAEQEIDAAGKYIIPGLIDIHMHIESSMAAPEQFADEIIKHGLTTIVSEPHEIANVFGIEGIKAMIKAGKEAAVDIFYAIPSSVPSTSSKLETTGADISVKEVAELIGEDKVICLGEVMNNEAVLSGDQSLPINKILSFLNENHPDYIIEGHIPSLVGEELAQFAARGINSDHCLQSVERLQDRIYNGVFVEIQEKSLRPEVINYIIENDVYEHLALVTDDVMADTLVEDGHLDHILRKIVEMGVSIENAIYMATYTPAKRMRLYDRGTLAPNKRADFIILDDLESFAVEEVYAEGKKVYNKEKTAAKKYNKAFPAEFYNSVAIDKLTEADLKIKHASNQEKVKCRIIEVKSESTYTEAKTAELKLENGFLDWEQSEFNLAAVISRYGSGDFARALITGSTIKRGAVATTYAHDHHNLYLIASNVEDGLKAANWVIENQGGYCVVENGEVKASLQLEVAGILTEKPLPLLAEKISKIREAMIELGYEHYNPIMSLSTNTLPVSPALKLTDKGLIDVEKMEVVSLFIDEEE